MKKLRVLLIIFIHFLYIPSQSNAMGGFMEFNKDRIIQESNQFLVAKGFNTEDKNIFLDEKNSLWKEFVSNKEFINNNPGILEKLEEGEYWAVNYQPKDNSTLGGEAWVFIDKNGRGVIFYFLLK